MVFEGVREISPRSFPYTKYVDFWNSGYVLCCHRRYRLDVSSGFAINGSMVTDHTQAHFNQWHYSTPNRLPRRLLPACTRAYRYSIPWNHLATSPSIPSPPCLWSISPLPHVHTEFRILCPRHHGILSELDISSILQAILTRPGDVTTIITPWRRQRDLRVCRVLP